MTTATSSGGSSGSARRSAATCRRCTAPSTQVVDRLREYEAVGVERVMLQQLLHDDLEQVSLLGEVATRLH